VEVASRQHTPPPPSKDNTMIMTRAQRKLADIAEFGQTAIVDIEDTDASIVDTVVLHHAPRESFASMFDAWNDARRDMMQ